jgi:hypothetical protein
VPLGGTISASPPGFEPGLAKASIYLSVIELL